MEQKNTRVLITGAAGHIGRELIRMLTQHSQSINVSVLELPTARNREFLDRYAGRISVFYGDLTQIETLEEATKGQDFVIHLASIIPPKALKDSTLTHTINVEGTRNLITQIEKNSPQAFFVLASSVAVYGDRLLQPYIRVTDPLTPAPWDYYAASKIKMEEALQESSLRWVIYRISAVFGSNQHVSPEMMFRMPLEQVMEMCTPIDAARAMLQTLSHTSELQGRIFNLGGGANCTTTYHQFLKRNFEIYGLGDVDFPLHAFANYNFHCGYYEDGDELDEILHFRRDTLEDYYKRLKSNTPSLQRMATKGLSKLVKSYLLSKSEPYESWLSEDIEQRKRFFR